MRTPRQLAGVALTAAGALLLITASAAGWTSSNLVLLAGLAAVAAGVALHFWIEKHGSKY